MNGKRLMVLGNARRPGVSEAAAKLVPWIRALAQVVVVDLDQREDLSRYEADITLVLGGDGAILRAARQMGHRQLPVLGVNLGRLGFLADLSVEALKQWLPKVLQGEYRITRHVMFEMFEGEAPGQDTRGRLALNDVSIFNGAPFHMLDLDLLIDGAPASRYAADGLIVSTPVGSTAHSLSAGGPILGQELDAVVITPLSPHGLGNRPLVESASRTFTIRLNSGSDQATVVLDGQETLPLCRGNSITVRKAPVQFQLIKVPGQGFYRTLREKLNWGTTPNYREEGTAGLD
jgi:NAD+ kinase